MAEVGGRINNGHNPRGKGGIPPFDALTAAFRPSTPALGDREEWIMAEEPELVMDGAFASTAPYGMHREPTFSGALSLFRRPYSKNIADADIVVSGVPMDLATSNRPGSRFGPR